MRGTTVSWKEALIFPVCSQAAAPPAVGGAVEPATHGTGAPSTADRVMVPALRAAAGFDEVSCPFPRPGECLGPHTSLLLGSPT